MRKSRLLLVLVLMVIALPARANAAVQGIGITPALQEVVLEQGEDSVTFKVGLANTTEDTVKLNLSMMDFGALDESGGIAFIGRGDQEASDYGLRRWVTLEPSVIELQPGASTDATVTITNDGSLRPGGHYGAVIVSSADEASDPERVAVVPAASSLVLFKKIGGENYQLRLESINANKSLLNLPKKTELKFRNVGNVHVVPRGTVVLSGPGGMEISRGVINETSSFVLPGSNRIMDVQMKERSKPWLPGRYTLTATWRFDGTGRTETFVRHYWYLGRLGIIVLIALCSVIVLIMYVRYRMRPPTRGL